jgi:hypothetical protein
LILYNGACLYSRLGEAGQALQTLRRAIAEGYEDYGWMKHDPDLDALRENPEFVALTVR